MGSATELDPVLRVQGLCFGHPGETPLFAHWSATLPAGLVWLAGDTGSGKTSLLQLLAGTWLAAAGRITLGRLDLATNPAAWRQQVCCFDPRDPAWDRLTPAGLRAALQALHPGQHPDRSIGAWQQHLQGFSLGPHLGKPLLALSTGSRRKAALAVALCSTAPLILLDEPTAGLDGPSLRHLAAALAGVQAQRRSVLVLAGSQGRDALPGAPEGLLITLTGVRAAG